MKTMVNSEIELAAQFDGGVEMQKHQEWVALAKGKADYLIGNFFWGVLKVIRYILSVILYLSLLPLSYIAAVFVPLFTRPMPHKLPQGYSWGGWFGTYDNPPQGDEGFVTKRCPFPNILYGWKGYVNRVVWMIRNKLYGLKRKLSINYTLCTTKQFRGNQGVSDKYRVAGWLFVTARCHSGKLQAFEWYSVTPYSKNRCLRVRLGWKIKGDKFDEVGEFAPLVFTINPLDSYGDD